VDWKDPRALIDGRLTGWIGTPEKRQFLGLAVMALAALSLWPPFDRRRLAYLAALVLSVGASFGHRGVVYTWLWEYVPLYRALRVPARFGHLVLLAVAVLAGYGAARIVGWLRPHRPRLALAVPPAIGLMIVAECLVRPLALAPLDTRPGEAYQWLARQPRGVVAEFPFPTNMLGVDREAVMQYRSTFHWMPLINGYSGFYPDSSLRLQAALATFPSPGALDELRRRDVAYLVVHEADYGRERFRAIVDALGGRDVEMVGPFREAGGEVRAYRLLPSVRAAGRKRILAAGGTP
jgi:hypothetical protein